MRNSCGYWQNMEYLIALFYCFSLSPTLAQQPQFKVCNLSLPKEIAFYDNQFSGLSIGAGKLFLLSESRLQDKAEAKLYTMQLADLDRKLLDTTYVLPYQKLPLVNLAALRTKINSLGQRYEGLEAMLIDQDVVYLSVETDTPSPNCYLLKGSLHPTQVLLDTTFLLPLAKPLAADGSHIYNASFEALAASNKYLVAFFEFNSFPSSNYAYELDRTHLSNTEAPTKLPFDNLPFRITDITAIGKNHFTALNFFFKGDGGDAIYRTPARDLANAKLIQDKDGYKNYSRLLDIELKDNKFTWGPLWELPEQYRGYNWEGITAYQGGYFLINDKYTPSRPYRTTLLYLQPVK